MPDTILNWIGAGLILLAGLIYYWPRVKEMLTGVPLPDETTPSGLKLYQGRTIDLRRLKNHSFNGCVFVDVNLINGAIVHIRKWKIDG